MSGIIGKELREMLQVIVMEAYCQALQPLYTVPASSSTEFGQQPTCANFGGPSGIPADDLHKGGVQHDAGLTVHFMLIEEPGPSNVVPCDWPWLSARTYIYVYTHICRMYNSTYPSIYLFIYLSVLSSASCLYVCIEVKIHDDIRMPNCLHIGSIIQSPAASRSELLQT